MKLKTKKTILRKRVLSILLFSLIFSILTGIFFAVMCGFFIPVVFTDWAGSFVCEGKMTFLSLKREYYCYTSITENYPLGKKVFWTMFRMFIFPCVIVCYIFFTGFFVLSDFVIRAEEK